MPRLSVRALGALVALAAAALVVLVVVRVTLGVPFGSDAYSYLAWARDLVDHGETGHAPYDYTVPKPLELGVATLATLLGAPVTLFGWWTAAALVAAIAAAAALAYRLAGLPAAVLAALLALTLPVLVRGSLAGDSNAPFAACAVGAAAAGPGTPAASLLLGAAGLLRPEGWGLAVLNLVLGFRRSRPGERALALAAVVVPPVLWLGLDRLLAGDWLYGPRTVDRYVARFHPPQIALLDLPSAAASRVDDMLGWPTVVLAVVALAAGLARRPLDPAVVYPVALALALGVAVARDQVTADALGRMLTALALFACVGAAAAIWELVHGGGVRALVAVAALVACLTLAVLPLRDARDALEAQGTAPPSSTSPWARPRSAPSRAAGWPSPRAAGRARWRCYGHLDRRRVVPSIALGDAVERRRAKAFLVAAGSPRPSAAAGLPVAAHTRHWRLYGANP